MIRHSARKLLSAAFVRMDFFREVGEVRIAVRGYGTPCERETASILREAIQSHIREYLIGRLVEK